MREKHFVLAAFCAVLAVLPAAADEGAATGAAAAAAPVAPVKARIAVLDFTAPEIIGQQRFRNSENKLVVLPAECTLSDADRAAMNSVMQGYVRMIDARDRTRTNEVNRRLLADDNRRRQERERELYNAYVKGQARPMLLGAEYLTGYLGTHSDCLSCMDASLVTAAMAKLAAAPDFPKDFLLRIAQTTGATHLIYGTLSDIRSKTTSFQGYGIATKSTVYDLDVILKVVDLADQNIVYSKVYTGTVQEQDLSTGGLTVDGDRYRTMMKNALQEAAQDLYECFKPGPEQKIKVRPVPSAAPAAVEAPAAPVAENAAGKPAGAETPEEAPASAGKPAGNAAPAPDAPAARGERTVIVQNVHSHALTKDGLPVAPPPPAAVPVAAEPGDTVVVVTH